MLYFCGQCISGADVDGKKVSNCDENNIKGKEKQHSFPGI